MKGILTIVLGIVSTLAYSQDINFKPDWNKGDIKFVEILQVERAYEDGELISDTTTYNDARIEVIKVSKDKFTLEIVMENQALRTALELYDKLEEELKGSQKLKLIYTVDKQTAESDLQNWKEAQKFMDKSFEQISSILEQKAPEFAPFIGFVFMPLKEVFKSKENIEAYMDDKIGYLLIPFNKSFSIGDTIRSTETDDNPFNPTQKISTNTLLSLQSVNEDSKTCIIHQEVQLDLSEFIEMMKGMIQKMSKSFGANDSITAKKTKEMDDFEMNIENRQAITFDYQTTWVTKVVGTGIVTATDPKKGTKTKKEIITTTVLK